MGPQTSNARILHPENPSTATGTPCAHSLRTGWTQRLWTRLPPARRGVPSSSASPAVAAHPLRMDFSELRVRLDPCPHLTNPETQGTGYAFDIRICEMGPCNLPHRVVVRSL